MQTLVLWFAFNSQQTAVSLGVFHDTERIYLLRANISIQRITRQTMMSSFEYAIIFIELKVKFCCYICIAYA